MITEEELESMGIVPAGHKLTPDDIYWCHLTQTQIIIDTETATVGSVIFEIYQKSYEKGLKEGKAQRSAEIKKLLNNNYLI